MELLNLKNVEVCYDGEKVLRHVNLKIFDKDFIAIIGPNGGGKSSLVKAILGIIPHEGDISFAPCMYSKAKRLKIGYMPQISLFDRSFPITIEEVVISGLECQGFRYNRDQKQKCEDLMKRVGINAVARKRIGEVSGGQMQRALLARSIISSPKLLILDEPTNFVDNNFEHEFYELLQELQKEMAIILISHDIGRVCSIVRTIVCVNKHLHRHDSNVITQEQLDSYNCPIQLVSHGNTPHIVLPHHKPCECEG